MDKRMSYDELRRKFLATIKVLISEKKGEKYQLLLLNREIGLEFGFGLLSLKRALEPYVLDNSIIIYKDANGVEWVEVLK